MNRHAIDSISLANAAQGRAASLCMKPGVLFGALKVKGGLSS